MGGYGFRFLKGFVEIISILVEEKIVFKRGKPTSEAMLTLTKRFKEFQVYILTYLLQNYAEELDMEKCDAYVKLLKKHLGV